MDSEPNQDDIPAHVHGHAACAQETETARKALMLAGPFVFTFPTHVAAADWPPLSDATPAMPETGGGKRYRKGVLIG
jgi:hypothetical protein